MIIARKHYCIDVPITQQQLEARDWNHLTPPLVNYLVKGMPLHETHPTLRNWIKDFNHPKVAREKIRAFSHAELSELYTSYEEVAKVVTLLPVTRYLITESITIRGDYLIPVGSIIEVMGKSTLLANSEETNQPPTHYYRACTINHVLANRSV